MTTNNGMVRSNRSLKAFSKIVFTSFALCGALILGGHCGFAADEEEEDIPEPENITLETKDGLNLKCTWFAGTKGKSSVPILMLHGFLGQRNEYFTLAKHLQGEGHAVLVPDLRGHGGSTRFKNGDVLKAAELKDTERAAVFTAMMNFDIETCKKFLMEKHNAEELNIEMLCLVAAEASTVLALNWAVADWKAPSVPAFKQGQDVKAVVLLSPELKIDKTPINNVQVLQNPLISSGKGVPLRLSIMIAFGSEDRRANIDAKKIHDPLKRARPAPDKKDELSQLDLFFDPYDTELQGTKLLDPRVKLPIAGRISNFITLRLVNKQTNFKWQDRTKPL